MPSSAMIQLCANMHENITEDNEYEEETDVVMLCRMILRSCRRGLYRINRINQMVKINNVLMAAILNFRELFSLKCMT